MTTPSPAIGAFWRAFSDAQASLQALPLRERVGAANALIDQHLEGLALEMSGDDADAVVDLIEEHSCDLVIIGTRAMGLLRKALSGSVAQDLVNASPVPVLLVKPPAEPEPTLDDAE